jgi:fructose-1,6-bisphosphatase II
VIAVAEHGHFLHAPDTYMDKIAVGAQGKGIIDIQKPPTWNLQELARAKACKVQDLTAIILERDRHKELIREVREAGARIKLIIDGDVSAALSTCEPESGVDILFGIGGAPEGVLGAAALRCLGGDFQGRLKPRNQEEIDRAKKMGIEDIHRVFKIDELASGHVMFAATGVTNGDFLKGVRFFGGGAQTHSLVMRSLSRTVRYIEATHHFDTKPNYP